MKKILLLNLVFLLFCLIARGQEPIDVGDLKYLLDTENQTAKCLGLSDEAIESDQDLNVEIPSSITVKNADDEDVEFSVKAINFVAFSDYFDDLEGDFPNYSGDRKLSKCVSISIPASVESLGDLVEDKDKVSSIFVSAFTNCSSLKEIIVDKDNPKFTSVDGVLYDKKVTKLLVYPCNKDGQTVEFPIKVTFIEDNAFFNCQNITSLVIPQGITNIGQNNFSACSNLTSVIFPKSLCEIANASFTFCDNLNVVLSYSENPQNLNNSEGNFELVPFSKPEKEPKAVLIVPNEMVEVYTLKGWGNYFDIQGILELEANKDAGENILSYTVTGLNSHLSAEQKALIDTVEIPAKFGEIAISEISANALETVEKVVIKENANIKINANNFSNLLIEENALVYVIGNVNVSELENDGKIIVLGEAVLTDDTNLYPIDENLQLFAQFNGSEAIADFNAIITQFQSVDDKTGFSIGFDVKNFSSIDNIFTIADKVIKFDTTSYSIKYQTIADVEEASNHKFTFCYNVNGSISCYIDGKLAYCLDKQSTLVGQIIGAYKALTYNSDPIGTGSIESFDRLEDFSGNVINDITNIYLSYGNNYLPKENEYYPYQLEYDKLAIRENIDGINISTAGLNVTFVLNDLTLGTKEVSNPEHETNEEAPEFIPVDKVLNEVLLATINGQELNFYEGDASALVKKINYLTLSLDPESKNITYYLNGSQVAQKENDEDFFAAIGGADNSFAFATGLKVENVFYAPYILEATDFEFVEIDGEYWIKGFKEGIFKEHIQIPNTYESLPVVGILENAFEDLDIISVSFEEDNEVFREIKDKAFYNNDTIERIVMPAKFQKFAATAFKDCKKFNNFDVTKASAYFVNDLDKRIVYSKNYDTLCFVADTTIAALTLDGGCHNIADYAMFNCKYISKINLNSTKSIGAHALDSCFSIHTLTIPQNVNEIKDYALANCWGLWQLVLINPANVNKGDYSNVLANEEGNQVKPFIFVPNEGERFAFVVNKTTLSNLTVLEYDKSNNSKITKGHLGVDCYHLQIPEKLTVSGSESNITTIGQAAFKDANNGKFNSVYLGQNVTTVEAEAFMNTTVEYLAIPWKINSIGDNAFIGCNRLKEAWYAQPNPIPLKDKTVANPPFNIRPDDAQTPILYIPHGSIDEYKAKNWDDYFFLKYPEDISWQGEVSTEWKNRFNWYADFLPTPEMGVRIDNTFGYPNPEIKNSGLDEVKSIYVAPGHSLTIEAGNKLTVQSIKNEGTIILKSNSNESANGSLIVDNYSGNDLIVERYIPEFYNRLSVPFENVSNYTFTYHNGKITKNFFTYNESAKILEEGETLSDASADDISKKLANAWVKVSNSTDLKRPVYLQVGKGYLFYNKYRRIVSVQGQPITSSLAKSISYTNNDSQNKHMDGWNLMGNPFTSAIDLNKVEATNTDGSVYVFKNDGTSAGSYDVMTNGLSTGEGGCYIPCMQAFMVRAKGDGQINFTKESRVHNPKEYQKNVRANVLRMSLNNDKQDNLIVYFEDGATDNFDDHKDAYKLSNDNINFYSLNKEEQFAINCLDPKEMLNKKVDLGFSSLNAGEFTISVKDITFDGVDIYLIDKQLNDSINLNLVNSYTFESSENASNDRFCLSFSKKAEQEVEVLVPEDVVMGIEDVDNLEVMVYPIPSNGKVNVSISNFENANYRVFDMMGKLIKADNIISNNQEIVINKSGVYVLELIIDNKQVIKKLIIKK